MYGRFVRLLVGCVLACLSCFAWAVNIGPGTQLAPQQPYFAEGGQYYLVMQNDGNLVYYRANGTARWNSQTQNNPGAWAIMQGDGNLVVYSASNVALWNTSTQGNPGAYLGLQGDGNMVVRRASDNAALWHIGADSSEIDICDNQPIPSGYAVVRRYTGSVCRGLNGQYDYATRTVRPLQSPMQVCQETLIPQGWVVTRMDTTSNCINDTHSSQNRQTWTISLPTSPMRVCSRSVQPAGFVIIGAWNDANCVKADFSSNFAGYDIKIPGQTEQVVCTWSAIPPGYRITNTFNWGPCAGGTTTNLNAVSIQRN